MCYFPFLLQGIKYSRYGVWLLISKEKEILVYEFLNKWTGNSHKSFVHGMIFKKTAKKFLILKNVHLFEQFEFLLNDFKN